MTEYGDRTGEFMSNLGRVCEQARLDFKLSPLTITRVLVDAATEWVRSLDDSRHIMEVRLLFEASALELFRREAALEEENK